jgi:hypothetical protein
VPSSAPASAVWRPPFLSGKDLASKLYSHFDNPDFGGHAKARFTTPKFYAQHGPHRHVLRPRNICRGTIDDSRLRADAVHAIAGTAHAVTNRSNTEVKIDYLPGLASDEKNLRSVRL